MIIAEASERSGLSISTIRYYERSGLCPAIRRNADGKRRFAASDTEWLSLLASLRATGMPLAEMHTFAALYASGDKTVSERKAALLKHRRSLDDRQAEIDRCRDILDAKLKKYDEILEDQG